MNSQTHAIMGALVFGKPLPRLAWFGLAGGVIPDLPMYIIVGGLRAQGHSLDRIFGEFYWQPWWQIANAIGHNFLLWGAVAVVSGWLILQGDRAEGQTAKVRFAAAYSNGKAPALIFALSASALIHSIIDFLVHRNDGHMHFWPLSEWRFQSPISYWDPNHYGTWFSLFEAGLGLFMAVLLMRRYKTAGVRLILALAVIAYAAVPAFYFWSLASHDHALPASTQPLS